MVQNKRQFFSLLNYFTQELFSVQSVWNFLFYSLTKVWRQSPLLITLSLRSPSLLSLEADIGYPTRRSHCPPSHRHTPVPGPLSSVPRPPFLCSPAPFLCSPAPFPLSAGPLSSVRRRWPACPVLALGIFCLHPTDLFISHFDNHQQGDVYVQHHERKKKKTRYWRFSSGRWSGLKRQWVSDIPPPHPLTPKYKKDIKNVPSDRAQELCESGGGRPGLPLPNSPYGFCGRKATLNMIPSNELGGQSRVVIFPLNSSPALAVCCLQRF